MNDIRDYHLDNPIFELIIRDIYMRWRHYFKENLFEKMLFNIEPKLLKEDFCKSNIFKWMHLNPFGLHVTFDNLILWSW